jgi:hypothetical protein
LQEIRKLIALLTESSGGEVMIAERALESLPHDIEIRREDRGA